MRGLIAAFSFGALLLISVRSAEAATYTYKGYEHLKSLGNPKQTFTVKPSLTAPTSIKQVTIITDRPQTYLFKLENGAAYYYQGSELYDRGTYTIKKSGAKTTVTMTFVLPPYNIGTETVVLTKTTLKASWTNAVVTGPYQHTSSTITSTAQAVN